MFKLLRPGQHAPSIYEIDLQALKDRGIRALILDIDNTIVEWGQSIIRPQLTDWVQSLKSQGFKLCILSNGSPSRVRDIAGRLDIPGVSRAVKPGRRAFRKALTQLEAGAEETAVIGDQLFTDILGGNRCSLFTILITPMSEKEFIYTRFVRRVERLVLKLLERKGYV